MTAAVMLNVLRTKLDEATASMWTDAECYQALTDGQMVAIDYLISIGKDSELLPLIVETNLTVGSVANGKWHVAAPTDMLRLKSAELYESTQGYAPVRIITDYDGFNFAKYNDLLVGTLANPTVYSANSFLVFEPAGTSNTATITYIKTPTDIASGTDSALLPSVHPAIVHYAFADLLRKAERTQEALNEFGIFLQMLWSIK